MSSDIWNESAGPAASAGGLLIAEVGDYNSSTGSTLILPGATAATTKRYRRISGLTFSSGDRVLVARISGTYVIIGKLL